MLEHFFQENKGRDRAIFWFFWILFIMPALIIPHDPPRSQNILVKYAVVISTGIILWRTLQTSKLLPVKKVVIGLQGFVLLLFGTIMGGMVVFVLLSYALDIFGADIHPWVSRILTGSLVFPGLFVAGWWLGFQIEKFVVLTILYALLAALIFWRFDYLPLYEYLVLIPLLIGSYFGRIRSAD